MTEQRVVAEKDSQASVASGEKLLQPGEVLFTEGQDSLGQLWLLLSGAVLVSREGRPIGQIRKGPVALDPAATFTLRPHRMTVSALEPSRVMGFDKSQLPGFFQARPPWAVHLLGQLAAALDPAEIATEVEPWTPPVPAVEPEPDPVSEVELPAEEPVDFLRSETVEPSEYDIQLDFAESAAQDEPGEAFGSADGSGLENPAEPAGFEDPDPDSSNAEPAVRESDLPAEFDDAAFDSGPLLPVPDAIASRLVRLGGKPWPQEMDTLIKRRLLLHARFQSLEQDQQFLLELGDLSQQVSGELRRQKQLLAQPPDAATVQTRLKEMEERLAVAKEKRQAGDPQAPDTRLVQAWELGLEQYRLLDEREQTTPDVLKICVAYAADQPFFAVLKRLEINPDRLFGLTLLAIALRQRSAAEGAKADRLHAEREQVSDPRLALTAKAREAKQKFNELLAAEEQARLLAEWSRREARWIERELVQSFWEVYHALALQFTSGNILTDEEPFVRAFLRWGMLGAGEPYLRPAAAQRILAECSQPVRQCRPGIEDEHVLYADEYLDLSARGLITPSVDEQLELDRQKVDDRTADRTHRRLIHATVMRAAYEQLIAEVEAREQGQYQRMTELAKELAALDPKSREYRATAQAIHAAKHDCKVEVARLKRSAEHIRQTLIGRMETEEKEARKRAQTLARPLTRQAIVDREVAGLRRVCRLVSSRQDVYLPFALAESFQVDQQRVHDRQAVLHELREAEKRDPLLFKDQVIPHKQRSKRIYLRQVPIVLIAPTRGVGSFSWNPRYATESGRLVLPCLSPESRRLRRILWEVLADFRYDTSKQSAGVDFLTSDTLAAAYATVRWNYKRRSREVRQKAAIYKEETDRMNWRRHYELYMRSAMEGGKLLYYKCAELYKPLLKYIALPDGIEPIRSN